MQQDDTPQTMINDLRAQNAQLAERVHALEQFVQSLEFISDAMLHPSDSTSADHLQWWLRNILEQTLEFMNAKDGSVLWLDPATQELEFVVVHGSSAELVGQRLGVGEGVAGWVAEHRQTTLVDDVAHDERFSKRLDESQSFTTQSILAAPLIGEGRVLGVVEILNKDPQYEFTELHSAKLNLFCHFAGELVANLKH